MAVYVLTSNPNAIDFDHAGLRARVESHVGATVALYRPYSFVEHSGFSETVREEIEMVLANQPAEETPLRPFAEFVEAWGLADHLDRRVLDLSGGWRKYLGLALFLNRRLPARLLLDPTSHLSDARMRTVLTCAAEHGQSVFCDYDPELLLRLATPSQGFQRLIDDGTTVSEVRES